MNIEELENLPQADKAKIFAAWHALTEVEDGIKIGIGTGSTASWFVRLLAGKQQSRKLTLFACATSSQTTRLARKLGIKIKSLDKFKELDLVIDGADEFDSAHNLIKGGGGALLQEKMTARSATRSIVITDSSKEVLTLGKFPLPVEVVKFSWQTTRMRIEKILNNFEPKGKVGKYKIKRRRAGNKAFITDEGHYILDLHLEQSIERLDKLVEDLRNVSGVVETGLFFKMADAVVMADASGLVKSRETDGDWVETRYKLAEIADMFKDIEE